MDARYIREMLKNDNIYCHLSTDIKFDGEFISRIPYNRSSGEDSTINRICISKTLGGALTAIPGGGSRLDEYLNTEYLFKICLVDINKLDIKEESIIKSDYLYETGLVPDAHITGECWITKPFKLKNEDMSIIKLKNWDEESEDVIPYHIEVIAEDDYDGDVYEAYEDMFKENVPCLTKIENPTFISECLKKRDSFEIEEDSLEEYQLDSIKKDYNSLKIDYEHSQIKFTALEDINVSSIFNMIYNNLT